MVQFAKRRNRFQRRSFYIYHSLARKIYREPRWNSLFLARKIYHDLDSCLHVWPVKALQNLYLKGYRKEKSSGNSWNEDRTTSYVHQ